MLKYTIELKQGGFTAEELKASGDGGADAIVVVSIQRGGKPAHTGRVSFAILSADSVGYDENVGAQEVPATELYQAMTMLAHQLSESVDVPQWQRDICADVMEKTRAIVNRQDGPAPTRH